MPLRDGTGPWGQGPQTGRRKGTCSSGFGYRNMSWLPLVRKNGFLTGIILSFFATVIRDLLNPSGILRQILHTSSHRRMTVDNTKILRETDCTVMDSKTAPVMSQSKASK